MLRVRQMVITWGPEGLGVRWDVDNEPGAPPIEINASPVDLEGLDSDSVDLLNRLRAVGLTIARARLDHP